MAEGYTNVSNPPYFLHQLASWQGMCAKWIYGAYNNYAYM